MLIKFLGDYSPYFFLIITSLSLFNNYDLLIIYLLGFIFNKPLNLFLESIVFYKYNEKTLTENNDMPSGHFQSMAYSFIFYILTHKIKNIFIIFLYLFISLCTFYNCIKFKYHTMIDIISGIITGFLFGYLYLKFSKLFFKTME